MREEGDLYSSLYSGKYCCDSQGLRSPGSLTIELIGAGFPREHDSSTLAGFKVYEANKWFCTWSFHPTLLGRHPGVQTSDSKVVCAATDSPGQLPGSSNAGVTPTDFRKFYSKEAKQRQ